MEMKKSANINLIIKMIIGSILSSLLYALAIACFVNAEGVNLLANGLGGIVIILQRLIAPDDIQKQKIIFAVAFIVLNIPLIILSYKKIGKLYTLFTIINIGLTSLFQALIDPSLFTFMHLDPQSDKLLIAICAGVLVGLSSAVALKTGSSTGGVDTLATYLGIKKDKEIGSLGFVVNGVIIISGGLIFKDWPAMLYTIVLIYVCGEVLDAIYRRNRKRLLKIITDKKDEVAAKLLEVSKHGITISECEGGYSHKHKYCIETVILETEVEDFISLIEQIDDGVFIYVLNVWNTRGKFTMPTFK